MSLRSSFAVRMNLSNSTAMLISLRLRVSYASHPTRCLVFSKTGTRRNISQMSLTILYVEDHKIVADAVKDTLEVEGWRVVLCYDGAAAIKRIESEAGYDLLIFDNHLPNVSGLELVRYARQLPHRERTPIITFSASEVAAEAREAGADAFLRKPQDVGLIVGTIKELVERGRKS